MSTISTAEPIAELEPLPEKQSHSYFEITSSAILKKPQAIANLKKVPGISDADRSFYEALLDLAIRYYLTFKQDPVCIPYPIFQRALKEQKLPSTRQTIMKRSKWLNEKGVLIGVSVAREGQSGRPIKRYITESVHLKDFVDRVNETKDETATQGHKITRRISPSGREIVNILKRSNVQFINSLAMMDQPKTDNFFTGVLDRGMRFDTREEVPDGVIISSVNLGSARLTIQAEATSRESSEIAVLADQRIIRAIITEVITNIEETLAKLRRKRSMNSLAAPADSLFDEHGNELKIPVSENLEDLAKAIQNSFYIDVVRIAKMMDYATPSSGRVRVLINQAIRRLYETNFRVVMQTSSEQAAAFMRERFGLDDNAMDFRFITDLKSQWEPEFDTADVDLGVYRQESLLADQFDPNHEPSREELKRSVDPFNLAELQRIRIWKISIDNHLFRRLLDKEARSTFLAHREILQERSGLAQTLYNVLSSRIGRTNHTINGEERRPLQTSLKDMHDFLWPERRFDRFEEHFVNLLKRHAANPERFAAAVEQAQKERRKGTFTPQRITMFGFLFILSIKDEQWWVSIERDKNDPLTGDNSVHNRLLKKAKAEAKNKRKPVREEGY